MNGECRGFFYGFAFIGGAFIVLFSIGKAIFYTEPTKSWCAEIIEFHDNKKSDTGYAHALLKGNYLVGFTNLEGQLFGETDFNGHYKPYQVEAGSNSKSMIDVTLHDGGQYKIGLIVYGDCTPVNIEATHYIP
jgi:hypothetical protein